MLYKQVIQEGECNSDRERPGCFHTQNVALVFFNVNGKLDAILGKQILLSGCFILHGIF